MIAPSAQLSIRRPLVPMEAAMCLLDRQEDDVLRLIERGALCFCFDIRHPSAKRREIRIFRDSLLHFGQGRTDAQPEIQAVIAAIIGNSAKRIRARRLADRFVCSSTHLLSLLAAGELKGQSATRGPSGSPEIERASAEAFLERRRVLQ